MSGKILPFRRPPAPSLTDEALLAACATLDTAALGDLFERFHLIVYRVLGRYLGGATSDLDDLVQATFLEVMRAARRFEGRSSARTFIIGVAVNVARHHRRSETRRQKMQERSAKVPQPQAPGPEQDAARAELLARLAAALEDLPHELRAVFVMCDLEELPGAEVARALQIPEGTLWRRLFDARRTLRRALGEEPS